MPTASLVMGLVLAGATGPVASVADANWCMGHDDPQHHNQVLVSACASTQLAWRRHGYELRAGGKCLDAMGGKSDEGTPVVLWECQGAANQRWLLQDQQVTLFGTNMCVAAKEDARGSGGVLVLASCANSPDQQWTWPPGWNTPRPADKAKGWLHSSGPYAASFINGVQYTQREFTSVSDFVQRCRDYCWKNAECSGFFEQTHLCPEPKANDQLTNPNADPGKGCYHICGFYDRGDNPVWGRAVVGPPGSVWIKASAFHGDRVQTPATFFDGPAATAAGP